MTTQNTSPSGSAITIQSLHRDHCEGTTSGTYQDVLFVVDLDLPDLGDPSPVQRRAHRGQESLTLGAQMVGIDLHAKSGHPTRAVEAASGTGDQSEEHTSELQSRQYTVCRLLLEKKNI